MNAYESARQKVIPAVLLYAFSGNEVLMIQKKDHWNGLGGKLDLGESPLEAAVREFQEESGLLTKAKSWTWAGQLFFPDFKSHKQEDWWCTVYTIHLSPEERARIRTGESMAEGTLHWIARAEIPKLRLWEGDTEFLPYVMSETPFEGTLFYRDGRCIRAEVRSIRAP